MSLGIYPVFNPPVPEAQFSDLGEVLATNFEMLDMLAEENNIAGLSAFADNRDVPEDFEGSPDELDERLGPFNDWFACSDAILDFRTLATLLEEDAGAAEELESPMAVIAELRNLARSLEIAEGKGALFRLEMS